MTTGRVARAQPGDIEEIVITATRSERRRDQVGSSLTVISGEEIEKSGQSQLVDVLRDVPGLSVTRAGGPGASSLVRLRGAEPGQTLVLLDGVELNDPASSRAAFDFDALLAGDIERVEVLRGPQSALYGNQAGAGVINIVTRRGEGGLTLDGVAEAGSFETFRAGAGLRGGAGPLHYALSAQHFDTEGFSAVDPPGGDTHEDDGARSSAVKGRVGLELGPDASLDLTGGWSDLHADIDPSSDPDGPGAKQRTLYHGSLRGRLSLFDERLEQRVTLSAARSERVFLEPQRGLPVTTFDGTRYGVELQSDLRLRGSDVLQLGAGYSTERAESDADGPGRERENLLEERMGTFSLFTQYQLDLFERLHVSLGARRDRNSRFGASTTYRVTAAFRPLEGTTLRASAGTGSKAPSLTQLSDPFVGNPDLSEERSFGVDLGVEQRLFADRLVFGVTGFYSRFRDLIAFQSDDPENPFVGQFVNLAEARTSGVEVSMHARPFADLRVSAAYTLLDTEDQETGDDLRRRPRNTISASLEYTPLERLRLHGRVRYVGGQFERRLGRNDHVPASGRVDLGAAYVVRAGVELYARVENVFDEKIADLANRGGPGRSLFVGARLRY